MLNELITRNDCANCKICCKFQEDELIDAPLFNEEQKEYINKEISSEIEFDNKNELYQIRLKKYNEKYICPLLSEKGCMLPNKYRPFDCESWPYYLMKKDNKYVITKSNDCPVFNKYNKEKLIKNIKDHFLSECLEVIKNNPNVITDYNRELEVLYEIDI